YVGIARRARHAERAGRERAGAGRGDRIRRAGVVANATGANAISVIGRAAAARRCLIGADLVRGGAAERKADRLPGGGANLEIDALERPVEQVDAVEIGLLGDRRDLGL